MLDYNTFIRCNPVKNKYDFVLVINIHEIVLTNHSVTVEHILPLKNAMSPMGFDPGTSRIASHRSTN